ncbi:Site-specific recombinase XerD [Actinomadura meyerae]|uniref:Site-specific recombinase XerD n=1 Tax=Actinomadura meyerae TaxID=240840 RepID=A0A239M226_9ACTN|nr:site-specific integrase [Actinomadura meyerae]SNT36731.1 Site-specific recombinase XerD [Actinomadura meyerae]
MAVYDRWHTAKPRGDEQGKAMPRCREHKQFPSADHGKGDRWQVRWRDENGKQCKRNFAKKAGKDPNTCADAFDAKVKADLDSGMYVDPNAGKITFREYAVQWLAAQTFDEGTRDAIEQRLRLHVYPDLGDKQLGVLSKRPSLMQAWLRGRQQVIAPNYVRVILAHVSTVFNAAIDDGVIIKNPCRASSVRAPKRDGRKFEPWPVERVAAVGGAITERYAVMVAVGARLGLRQGEAFGLAEEDVDFLRGVVHVRRQIEIFKGRRKVFALPKGGKERDIPLPESLRLLLAEHMQPDNYPPVPVTLPWKAPDGDPVTARLIFTTRQGTAIHRSEWNRFVWKPALVRADVSATRDNGFHALRHHFASVLLEQGVDIRALAEFLGHADPGFTLRTYTHLMPSSRDRMRKAIDDTWGTIPGASALDVPSREIS